MSSYGYMPYYKPIAARNTSGLASAAASKDPYGLAPNNRSGPLGIGASTGFASPPRPPAAKAAAPASAPVTTLAANPYGFPSVTAAGALANKDGTPWTFAAPSAAAVNNYDLSTDNGLQQITSLVGKSNADAQSGALKQRQNLLLAYGDPNVATSVLGADDPIAAAAGQNPTSTVAQLGEQRDRNLKTLDDGLNADNLSYSGYRITQEQQAGQDYQNALAQAAAGLNSNLDQVNSNLGSVLAGNNAQVAQGISSAADRASQAAIASGIDPGAIDPNALPNAAAGGAGGGAGATPPDANSGYSPDAPGGLPVGATNNAALYRLLGRKTDPRYNI